MATARDTTRSGQEFFALERAHTALLVVDMQNGFLAPGSILEVPAGREIVPRLTELIEYCRDQSVPIVWIQLDSTAPMGGLMLKKYPPIEAQRVLFKGTSSFDLFPSLPAPVDGEHRIVKHKYDAFYQSELHPLLRKLAVDTVIVTGVTTNCCCESTARSAFERDYKVAFTSDATAAFEPALHEASLRVIDELFGRVLTVAEAIAELDRE